MSAENGILKGAPNDTVAEAVSAAVVELFYRDAYLFRVDANERSITHHLAAYLAPRFPDWHVDCEYNRDGFDPKMVPLHGDTGDPDTTDGSRIYPDIIIHRRGKSENLLVIEAKKSTSRRSDEADQRKLRALRGSLGYQYSLFLRFGCRNTVPTVECVRWASGPSVHSARHGSGAAPA